MFTLLVFGATGLVGQEVVRQALESPQVSKVIAVTRRPIQAHPKLENPVINFDQIPSDAPWWKVDGAICAMGTTTRDTPSKDAYHRIEVDYPLAFARNLKKHGAKSFAYTSSVGASSKSRFGYLKMKGEIENQLKEVGFRSTRSYVLVF